MNHIENKNKEAKEENSVFFDIYEKGDFLYFIKEDDIDKIIKELSTKELSESEKSEFVNIAAKYGSIKCFKFFQCNKFPFNSNVTEMAIQGGNKEIN